MVRKKMLLEVPVYADSVVEYEFSGWREERYHFRVPKLAKKI